MKLSFHGAARTVTGSCHFLDTGHHKILFDCGLFQGAKKIRALNYEKFKFDPSSIDYLFLSHAHLDHTGRIPKLVKQGFKGRIICTRPTRDLARLILLDAVRLSAEDYKRALKRNLPPEKLKIYEPLYNEADVFHAIGMMDTYNYSDSVKLSENLEFQFRGAGHIMGSAITELWVKNEQDKTRKIVFSGDLGHRGQRIVKDPDMVSEADYVIVESTYGNRFHKSRDETVLELLAILHEANKHDGNVIIPTFAVERAQELIYELNLFKKNKLIDKLSVYLDSPMAIEATEIFKRYESDYDEDAARLVASGNDPLEFKGLHYSKTTDDSKALNNKTGVVLLAGSGMATGGRVLIHLRNNLPRSSAHVIFVGFQVPGTLGRSILDGKNPIKIFGEEVKVQAKTHTLGGFSAHADQRDLEYWLRGFGKMPQKVFMVHGEESIATEFAANIKKEIGQDTYVPSMHEEFELI